MPTRYAISLGALGLSGVLAACGGGGSAPVRPPQASGTATTSSSTGAGPTSAPPASTAPTTPAPGSSDLLPYSSAAGRFDIQLPVLPAEKAGTEKVGNVVLQTHTIAAEKDATHFVGVLYIDVPSGTSYDPAAGMRGSVYGSATSVGGTVTSFIDRPFGRYPGREAMVTSPQASLGYRTVVVGRRLYTMFASPPSLYRQVVPTFHVSPG